MNIKLGELISVTGSQTQPGALRNLIVKELPIKAAYRLGRLMTQIDSEFNQYEEARTNLVKKYGNVREDGGYEVDQNDQEKYQLFFKEVNELLNMEVPLSYQKISINELGDIKITPTELLSLEAFFHND